jgi:hypothetical protein
MRNRISGLPVLKNTSVSGIFEIIVRIQRDRWLMNEGREKNRGEPGAKPILVFFAR